MLPAREIRVVPPAGAEADDGATAPELPVTGGESEVPVTAAERSPWLWVSLLLALGWISSLIYWWFRSRPAASPREAAAETPSLRSARRELQQACESDDATAARVALLDWGRALLAPRPIANLQQLCAMLGGELEREVEELNRSRYARDQRSWRGADLWQLCRQLEAARPQDPGDLRELVPLNPR